MPKLFHLASLYGSTLLTADVTSTIDMDLVDTAINLVTKVIPALFTTFPNNLYLIFGLAGASVALFRKGKKAAK